MKTKRILLIVPLAVGLIAIAFPVLRSLTEALGLTSPARTRFYRNYDRLKIGMPKAEIRALFGETPTYSCRLSNSEIWYFGAPGRLTGKFPDHTPERGTPYGNAADLSDIYGHIQFAFDSNDGLTAFTFIGESYTTEWRGGSVKGTHFKHLPPGSL